MELHLLGSGGWFPTRRRETCCALVRADGHALLLDAGSGLTRLLEEPELLAGATEIDLVLTHFHLDHVSGLACLPALADALRPRLWAPGELLGYGPSLPLLERLLAPPLFAAPPGARREGGARIAGRPARARPLRRSSTRPQSRHPHPTLALRIGDALAYCTDTELDPATAAFAAGVGVLCHEAWQPEDAGPGHTSAADAGAVASEADVGRLVLIHVHPLLADEGALAGARWRPSRRRPSRPTSTSSTYERRRAPPCRRLRDAAPAARRCTRRCCRSGGGP